MPNPCMTCQHGQRHGCTRVRDTIPAYRLVVMHRRSIAQTNGCHDYTPTQASASA